MQYANKMRKDSSEREAKTEEMVKSMEKKKSGHGIGMEQLEVMKRETEDIEKEIEKIRYQVSNEYADLPTDIGIAR